LQHGNNGAPGDWIFICEALQKQFAKENPLFITPKSNTGRKTLNGIRVCAQRLKDEIIEELNANKDRLIFPARITFMAHSLGGLISRCCFPLLFNDEEYGSKLIPWDFISMSSPHLGSRRPESGGIIKKTWRFLVHGVVRMLYSQTGKELLYEEPNLETKDQLLCQLSDPSKEYYKQLERFRYRTLIGIAHYDNIVPFCSAVICNVNPYEIPAKNSPFFYICDHFGFDDKCSMHFKPYTGVVQLEEDRRQLIVENYQRIEGSPYVMDNAQNVEFPVEVLVHLRALSWRRLCVQFGNQNMLLMHDMTLKKNSWKRTMPWLSAQGSVEFIDMLANIVASDLKADANRNE
jgi:hypothetical protein